MIRALCAIAAATMALASAVAAEASPAGAFINGHHWMCDGTMYSIDTQDNQLPYRMMIGANAGTDGTFTDIAWLDYNLDGHDYMAAYTTSGYLFDNDNDGAGLYFDKDVIDDANSDSLYATPIRWTDRFTLNLHAVANEAGAQYPYHLEGQMTEEAGDVSDLSCQVYIVPK